MRNNSLPAKLDNWFLQKLFDMRDPSSAKIHKHSVPGKLRPYIWLYYNTIPVYAQVTTRFAIAYKHAVGFCLTNLRIYPELMQVSVGTQGHRRSQYEARGGNCLLLLQLRPCFFC